MSDERGDEDLPEDFLRLRPHPLSPPPRPPFLPIFITTAPGPVRTLIEGLRRPSPQRARQESRAASVPAVVSRADSNSISPTQRGEERTLLRRVLHAAYQSSVINLETNCRSPRRPIAERCNGPAMKGVDGTVRRRRAARSAGGGEGNSAANGHRKANNNNNYLIRVDGGEERSGGKDEDLREFVISVMGCSTRVTCRLRLN